MNDSPVEKSILKKVSIVRTAFEFINYVQEDNKDTLEATDGHESSEGHKAEDVGTSNAGKEKYAVVVVLEATTVTMVTVLGFYGNDALANVTQVGAQIFI